MKRTQSGFGMLLFVLLLLVPVSAQAEAFVKPSLENFLKTLIRFGTLDTRENKIIDAYGRIMACDLFEEYYDNDFQWQKIRGVLRESVKKEVGLYPTGYRYDATLQLGRYNFEKNLYEFTEKTRQEGVTAFRVNTASQNDCKKKRDVTFPDNFAVILEKPIQLLGIPMSSESGEKLLKRLEEAENKNHLIHVRFNLQIVYVAPFLMKKVVLEEKGKEKETKNNSLQNVDQLDRINEIQLDAKLNSVEYYEDAEYKKMFYKQVF
jgi:hypothetical protein